jgi:hypothetical protein
MLAPRQKLKQGTQFVRRPIVGAASANGTGSESPLHRQDNPFRISTCKEVNRDSAFCRVLSGFGRKIPP